MDATSLTSSLGYDGSVSEMYSAWVSGCAVVLLTKEQVRSGPDLVPVLREAEVTVLFCPPVLLSTLTRLPSGISRIRSVGTSSRREKLSPCSRRAVDPRPAADHQHVRPHRSEHRHEPPEPAAGEPVTIGSPFPNVTYVVLEACELRPLPHGETGELCIGGYTWRAATATCRRRRRKFITHPRFGRLYRTGDKCRIDVRTQRVHFLGRIDAQLKVRGHRVEIEPVEDLLRTQFREIEAAVLDYQNGELVAFVAAPSLRESESPAVAPAPPEWASRVTESLARQLPTPSVR